MKGLGETSPFHRFTNPQRDNSVYLWSWCSYLLYMITLSVSQAGDGSLKPDIQGAGCISVLRMSRF